MTDLASTWTSRMNEALRLLAESDEQEAELRTLVEKSKKSMDAKFKTIAAHSGKKIVLEREAYALEHAEYQTTEAAYLNALTQHGKLKNERATHVITIDVWRSLNAARNKGQIV